MLIELISAPSDVNAPAIDALRAVDEAKFWFENLKRSLVLCAVAASVNSARVSVSAILFILLIAVCIILYFVRGK